MFNGEGYKVIPCNEFFDTKVDNTIISDQTLNGKFILHHVDDITDLRKVIEQENPNFRGKNKNNKIMYRLGHIIKFKEFLLLAFTHFNKHNVAHLSNIDYVICLINMWKELRIKYSGKPISLPLLGSGITKFDNLSEKNNFELLQYMIWSLKISGEQFTEQITIVVTPKVWKDLNLLNNDSLIQ